MKRIHVKFLVPTREGIEHWRYEWIWAEDLSEFIGYWKARPYAVVYFRIGIGIQRANAHGDIWERV